jgi:FKBP-type peptidyl-prolyl cis-trans isomerase
VRTAAALVLAGIVAASLTACSTGVDNGDCTPAAAGSVSDGVNVSGEFGSEPTVTFSSPLTVETTQRTVEIASDTRSEFAESNDEVTINFVLYNGTTGEKLSSSFTDGQPAIFTVNDTVYLPGLIKSIACSAPGDRVTGVIPPSEAFGANGSTNLAVAAGESLVFVVDIISIAPGMADGEPQPPVDGLPTVTLADDGTPTIEIPDTDPPADLQIAVLKKGDGAVVGEGDSVKVQYLGMNWNTKTVFDQSWNSQGPVTFTTTGVVEGFGTALVGQTVGPQVLVVIPPDLGYGPVGGNANAGIGATDTIVFVIDILATSPAAG